MDELFKPDKEFDQKRDAANKELLWILTNYLKNYPYTRLGQALNNLDIIKDGENIALLEPTDILERVKNNSIYKRMVSEGLI